MSFQKVYEILCDGCSWMLVHAYSYEHCRREIKNAKWRTKGNKHYCPDCVRKGVSND
jgi:hypothetical protein